MVAVIVVSWSSILSILSDAEAIAIAFWRTTIASALLSPYLVTRNIDNKIGRKEVCLIVSAGAMLSLHFVAWIQSLFLTSVAASTTLVSTYPLFAAMISRKIGDRLSFMSLAGIAVALLGIFIITTPTFGVTSNEVLGNLLAFIGSLSGAIYFSIGRLLRRKLRLLSYTLPVYATSSLFTLAVGTSMGARLLSYPVYTWGYLIAIAAGPMLAGHTLLNYALRYSRAVTVTTSTLGEPIGASLLAWLVLSQVPKLNVIVGMGVTLLGIYLVVKEELRR